MRSKLDGKFAAYVQASEKEKLLSGLQDAEDWLYTEEGEEATKSAYVARLDALKAIGDPIVTRYRETEERPRVISELRESLNNYISQATSSDPKYEHIDAKDKQSVVEKAATIQKWLDDQIARQSEKPKNVDPVLKGADILKKKDEIIYFATPILMKPKPKPVKVDATPTGTPQPQSGTQTPSEQPPPPPAKEDNSPPEMDVD